MFQLNKKEWDVLKSQIVISKRGGARRAAPYAFTEQGVAMLSSVLKSERAVAVNIAIMRAFVKLREYISTHRDLEQKFDDLERRIDNHDEEIAAAFEQLRQLMTPPAIRPKQIGFKVAISE